MQGIRNSGEKSKLKKIAETQNSKKFNKHEYKSKKNSKQSKNNIWLFIALESLESLSLTSLRFGGEGRDLLMAFLNKF